KVRLGCGKTGQQDITGTVCFYPSIPLFLAGSNSSQYLPGSSLYSALPFNPNLTWEKTTTYNLGLDFDFFNNSFLTGSFDIYKRETRSEEHTSELQSRENLVCRLLLEKKKY